MAATSRRSYMLFVACAREGITAALKAAANKGVKLPVHLIEAHNAWVTEAQFVDRAHVFEQPGVNSMIAAAASWPDFVPVFRRVPSRTAMVHGIKPYNEQSEFLLEPQPPLVSAVAKPQPAFGQGSSRSDPRGGGCSLPVFRASVQQLNLGDEAWLQTMIRVRKVYLSYKYWRRRVCPLRTNRKGPCPE